LKALKEKMEAALLACSGSETPEEIKEKKALITEQKNLQAKITKKLEESATVRKEQFTDKEKELAELKDRNKTKISQLKSLKNRRKEKEEK